MGSGGWVDDYYHNYAQTTEILIEGASKWKFVGNLPTGRHHLKGASLNNRIFMLGGIGFVDIGRSKPLDDVLEFNIETEKWKEVANMKRARKYLAVDVFNVDVDDIKQYCK